MTASSWERLMSEHIEEEEEKIYDEMWLPFFLCFLIVQYTVHVIINRHILTANN